MREHFTLGDKLKLLSTKVGRSKGQVVTVLNLFLAVFVVFLIGLFAFELSRYLLARDELKTNVEVAALSCQSTLVSSGDPTNATNQTNAQNAGLQLFRQNSILGQTMTQATLGSNSNDLNPAPGHAQINFQFLDPVTRQPVNQSGAGVSTGVTAPASAGTLIQAVGAYSYSPAFGQFIGLGNAQFTFQVSALSGVPKIDLMVLLDISGSMDSDTSLSTYQRYQTTSGTNWMVNPNPVNGGNPAQGTAYSLWCSTDDNLPNPPRLGALYPTEYDRIKNASCTVLKYSEDPTTSLTSNHLQLAPGMPPGNWCMQPNGQMGSLPKLPRSSAPYSTNDQYQNLTAFLNTVLQAPLKSAVQGQAYSGNQFDKLISTASSKNMPPYFMASSDLLSYVPNQDLLDLCSVTFNESQYTKENANKLELRQAEHSSRLISFAPQFYALPQTFNTQIPPTNNASPPSDSYTGSNGQTYFSGSRASGSGADTGPTVLPTTSGYCTPEPTGYGASAPTVFTGAFVNGVLGASSGNMTFSNSVVAIEAMLGDLESSAKSSQAGIDTTGLGVSPQAGWFAFYYNTARQYLQPYMAIISSLIGFINELAIVSDVHYGFIAFNDSVGTNANSVSAPVNNASSVFNYPTMNPLNPTGAPNVSNTFPLPNVQLSPTISNQSTIISLLPNLSVWSTRNVSQALQTAYNELRQNGRPGANQAIVLVVSGIPNGSDTTAKALQQAGTIGQAGIPIYVVCTSVQSSDDSANDSAYTDAGGSNGGVAGVSAHGARYYRVDFSDPQTTTNELVTVFGNIARRLVSIIQKN